MTGRSIQHFGMALILGVLLLAPVATGQEFTTRAPIADSFGEQVAGTPVDLDSTAQLAGFAGPVVVMVELDDPPTTKVWADKMREGFGKARAIDVAKAHLGKILDAQAEVRAALFGKSIDARELYSLQRVLNGLAIEVDARHLGQIRRLPGVRAVRVLPLDERTNSSSVPFIGTPEAWAASGFDGSGVTIGVIDTGIDYLHANFGGSGDPADYAANDTTILDGFFPTAKVAGGFDFAGDNYNASDPANNVPQPDDDPLDCPSFLGGGHGSHVAGSAAGFGVNADGTTFTGPYDDAVPFGDLLIGPGTAPGATLYALRVFGCVGSTFLTSQAIEWAVDPNGDGDFSDRLDVINLSLGSGFGSTTDASAVASNNAALTGMIVAAASGNNGDIHYITGSPGVASYALSVSASQDGGLVGPIVDAPGVGNFIAGSAAFGAPLDTTGVTSDLVAALDDDSDGTAATDACTPLTNPAEVAGNIALIDRGNCNFTVKVKNAQDAGAVGAIVANNAGDGIINMAGTDDTITISSVFIGQSNGQTLRDALAGGPFSTNIRIGVQAQRGDVLAGFSSRGPARLATAKPDITAPGQSITSTLVGDATIGGTNPLTISGTSMATPHVAGILALLRQAHPDWTSEEIKALAINTSLGNIYAGLGQLPPLHAPARVGSGRSYPPAGVATEVVALSADPGGAVSVTFDTVDVAGVASETKTIRVVNKGASDVTLEASYSPRTDVTGVDFSLGQTSVTVPAGGEAALDVTMSGDSSQMLHLFDPTLSLVQNGLPRHWLSEESGIVELTDGSTTLRVPVYATVRPASGMRSLRNFVLGGQREVLLDGLPVFTAGIAAPPFDNPPFAEISLVTAHELQYIDPNDPGTPASQDGADIGYVGVSTDVASVTALGGNVIDGSVYFAIATHGEWATPSEVQHNVFIDVDRDGTSDFQVFNGSFGALTGAGIDDVFVDVVIDLSSGAGIIPSFINGISANLDTVLFNTNVMVLPVPLAAIGATGPFDYFVVSQSREAGTADITPTLTYNPARPGIDFTDAANQTGSCPCPGVTAWLDLPGAIPMDVDRRNLRAVNSLGALLLHHHNTTGNRAEPIFHGRRLAVGQAKPVSDGLRGGFTYFALNVTQTNSPPITISTSGGGGEIELYARWAGIPTQDIFDYRSDNGGTGESITIDDPQPGIYYIGVLAVSPYAGVTISAE